MLSIKNEKGRSLIEMLGVLAIMSIITVLGVTAFNSANRRIKGNNLKSEVAEIVSHVRSLTLPDEFGYWVATNPTGKQMSFESAFVDAQIMDSFNAMGTDPGYELEGQDSDYFEITIFLDEEADCHFAKSLGWREAESIDVNCVDTGTSDITLRYIE
ncbi:MAG: type II secretion system GspH family protein [Alphaproteobacteria bacterium]|nr:type II secretion system GspH family protein [Alphaproteobacteria bacterium]